MPKTPRSIEPHETSTIKISWEDGSAFSLPYVELRFYCPCAGCVDENTGQRTLVKSSLDPLVRPLKAEPVGRYAVQFEWSDGHQTGIYHYDRLWELCEKQGAKLS